MPGGGDDIVGRGVLRHEGARARVEGLEELLVAGVHREDDDAELGVGPTCLAGGVDARPVGQAYVEDDDVGGQQPEQAQRVGAGAGLADHLELAGALEGTSQSLPDQLVVVDQQHRDRHRALLPCGTPAVPVSRGSAPSSPTSTTVPPPTRLRTDNVAPRRWVRSLMMSNP